MTVGIACGRRCGTRSSTRIGAGAPRCARGPRMTIPLWCLAGFVVWTLVLLTAVAFSRVGAVLAGRARANEFPSGVPHGGDRYWRLNRAHMNCVENLPLFGAVVLIAAVAGIRAPALD